MNSNEKFVENECLRYELNELLEIDEIIDLVKQLCTENLSTRSLEINHERFNFILKQYQDQPQLLDPHLEQILQPLLEFIKDDIIFTDIKHYVFKYIYIIISVKTFKKIAMYLPHDVGILIPVLEMIENQDSNDKNNWQTRYVLLIWLSIISKIPFKLSQLENYDVKEGKKTIVNRIMEICKVYCCSKDACFNAAVFLLTNFLTRVDVKEDHLENVILWSLKNTERDILDHRPLTVQASILKHCNKEDVLPFCQLILNHTMNLQLQVSPADLVRKYLLKVIQRIGLVILGKTTLPWDFPTKEVTSGLTQYVTEESCENFTDSKMESNSSIVDDQIVPPAIEDILEHLIRGLQDKTIVIRWSAAKGVGRIAARLPNELGDDVLGYILNLFITQDSETAWHGGCLALAELGRRSLLPLHSLKDVIPFVLRALVYDEPRAYGPVGSIIRDAACFVCWSFSRAFKPEIFTPFMKDIITSLLLVTCFDREINCRRAASAALQEIIGRQGDYPYGLELITLADYFEVGIRSNAFLNISQQIACYPDYTHAFMDHLVEKKVIHWDEAIRELSSKSLYNIVQCDIEYTIGSVLPKLLSYTESIDLNIRHGGILSISEIIVALHEKLGPATWDELDIIVLEKMSNIVGFAKCRGHFRGIGGELIKQACISLIKNCALVNFKMNDSDTLEIWFSVLEECLINENKSVRCNSAAAHNAFLITYFFTFPENIRNNIVDRYTKNLLSNNQLNRIGYSQAVGYFPKIVLQENLEKVLTCLIHSSYKSSDTMLWAESRKESLRSISSICTTLGTENIHLWKTYVSDIFNCFLNGLSDYSNDNRGDIGSWVRETAMNALQKFTDLLSCAKLYDLLNEERMKQVIAGITKQAVERIDRTRAQAGKIFFDLLYSNLPNIPHQKNLALIFPNDDNFKGIDWKSESETFPLFVQILQFPCYMTDILTGIIYSVGGLSESLVKHSSSALFSFLQQQDIEFLKKFCNEVANIFEINHQDDRMISSVLAFFDRLFSSGSLQRIKSGDVEIYQNWIVLLKKENKYIHSSQSQLNVVKIYCHLLQIGESSIYKAAFSQLSIYLCHKYKFLRKATAARLYETLTLYGEDMDIPYEDLIFLQQQLNAIDWEKPVEELRPARNSLCERMKIPVPTLRARKV